jgi:phosphatidylserine decarboxylase
MTTKVIDRKTNNIIEEKSPKGANFLYKNIIGRIILKLATKRFVSRIVGRHMDKKKSTKYIANFIKDNNIDMSDYNDIEYKSFNDFFSRKIKDGKRNFSGSKNDFCAPSDSKVTVYKISEDKEFIIKNKKYTIDRILRDTNLAKEYQNGYFLVFRLSVDDYHRYAYIDNGKLLKRKEINGKFHTVGPIAFERFEVYEENQRVYELLKTENFKEIIQMEVGAMMVGKIVNHDKKTFKKGEEKGYFLFGGSTIVIMVKENIIKIDEDILKNSENGIETKVKQGERIAKRL